MSKDKDQQGDERQRRDESAEPTVEIPTAGELQTLRGERDQFEEQLRHALADAANMRRRMKQELDDSRRRIVEGFTQELLPVLDNFRLALNAWDERSEQTDPKSLVEGIRMVLASFRGALERHGLAEIAAENAPFDPARHEALGVEPRTDVPAGQVVRVLMPGYLLGDRVLRHAKVIVAGEPPKPDQGGPDQGKPDQPNPGEAG